LASIFEHQKVSRVAFDPRKNDTVTIELPTAGSSPDGPRKYDLPKNELGTIKLVKNEEPVSDISSISIQAVNLLVKELSKISQDNLKQTQDLSNLNQPAIEATQNEPVQISSYKNEEAKTGLPKKPFPFGRNWDYK
jgi:hypothetical protein